MGYKMGTSKGKTIKTAKIDEVQMPVDLGWDIKIAGNRDYITFLKLAGSLGLARINQYSAGIAKKKKKKNNSDLEYGLKIKWELGLGIPIMTI